MLATLLLFAAAGTHPIQKFSEQNPASKRLQSADGHHLVHASGFVAETGARRPEDAARVFLSTQGAAFGVTDRQELVLEGAPAIGEAGAVRFQRRIDGLPVFGGNLVVGVDAQSRVFVVNSGNVAPTIAGRHALDERAARQAATSSFADDLRGAGPAKVTAGWRTFGPSMRAVYRVDVVAEQPAGDWRVFVDGERGKMLLRQDLRSHASAEGTIFEVSPVETAASVCPLSGTSPMAPSFCASPVKVAFPNLSTGSDLIGTQTSVFNCKGANAPTSTAGISASCAPIAAVGGAFNFAPDLTYQSNDDDFAAAMAYYHLDKHASFFKRLDPSLPPVALTSTEAARALRGSLPALVNAYQGNGPLRNAYFSGLLDAMVFGQGPSADFAYDASVIYHEFTHGVVFAWGHFAPDIDSLGGYDEPAAVNEGTADSMAVSETGRSQVGSFIGATGTPRSPVLRDMADPTASRTCQGDGTTIQRFGAATVNGLDGEVHDDGEIWNGFYWEVYQGLKAAGVKACNGTCDAGPALQYKAVQLAGGTSPSFNSYWQTFKSAASALFPSQPEVASYVDCVAKRRKLDRCDRTVSVYAGESKLQFIRLRYSPFQVVLPSTGPTQFSICSGHGTTTKVYARKGQPARLTGIDPDTGTAIVEADFSATFEQLCSRGQTTIQLPSAGTWYLLLDSPSALVGETPGYDIYRIEPSTAGMAPRPTTAAVPACAFRSSGTPSSASIAIAPASVTVAPKGRVAFAATGGSSTGYSWSLITNRSGGSIEASSGAYTAGSAGGVTDVVKVTDSSGNTANADVTVAGAVAASGTGSSGANAGHQGGGCSTAGIGSLPGILLALVGLLRRRRNGALQAGERL